MDTRLRIALQRTGDRVAPLSMHVRLEKENLEPIQHHLERRMFPVVKTQ